MNSFMTDYDNFIFDLYGTLIDILTDEYADSTWIKFNEYLDGLGIKHPDVDTFRSDFFALDKAYRAMETPYDYPEIDIIPVYSELFERYGNGPEICTSTDFLNKVAYAFRSVSREYMRLFPGLEEFLKMLKASGKKIYILTNAQASYTLPEIKYFGLDKTMDDILISSDYKCMKPDAFFYNAIITKHHMDKERTVMLGDSYENDYRGAINAGISGIWLGEENCPRTFYLNCVKAQKAI